MLRADITDGAGGVYVERSAKLPDNGCQSRNIKLRNASFGDGWKGRGRRRPEQRSPGASYRIGRLDDDLESATLRVSDFMINRSAILPILPCVGVRLCRRTPDQ